MTRSDASRPEIRELVDKNRLADACLVLQELRDHLDREERERYHEQMRNESYRLFGWYDADELVAVAGITLGTNFYLGKHVFVYDLVTAKDRRSEGTAARCWSISTSGHENGIVRPSSSNPDSGVTKPTSSTRTSGTRSTATRSNTNSGLPTTGEWRD